MVLEIIFLLDVTVFILRSFCVATTKPILCAVQRASPLHIQDPRRTAHSARYALRRERDEQPRASRTRRAQSSRIQKEEVLSEFLKLSKGKHSYITIMKAKKNILLEICPTLPEDCENIIWRMKHEMEMAESLKLIEVWVLAGWGDPQCDCCALSWLDDSPP